jgi:cysteine desulfurase
MQKKIYLDYAATTPVEPEVVRAMLPYFDKKFGNPSSLHSWGREAKLAIDQARESIAELISAKPEEIIFTSGGTEADNLAIKGIAMAKKSGHIITSAIEHHAILNTCRWLEKVGFEITYLPVDRYGFVNPKDVEEAIKKNTILVTIMHSNNEIGTIEPIEKIAKICAQHNIPLHTDAVQSFGKIPLNVKRLGVDMLSASSHKIYGPKGAGCLYVRSGLRLTPMLHGGHQEFEIRVGTENVPAIVGFGKAVQISKRVMAKEYVRLKKLKNKLVKGVAKIPDCRLNGHPTRCIPGIANFSFDRIEGESLVLKLDMAGIATSTGSACAERELKPSHVLTAIGLSHVQAHGSLRISLGRHTTENDIDYLLEILPKAVEELRAISPLKK